MNACNLNTENRANYLLNTLTAFRTVDEIRSAVAGGYVPTILPRTARHGELSRLLVSLGIPVFTGYVTVRPTS